MNQVPASIRPGYDINEARAAVLAGGVQSATLRVDTGRWFVEFVTREAGIVDLVTARRDRRAFGNPELALKVLREMGLTEAQVKMEAWDLSKPPVKRSRPDSEKRLKAVFERAREAEASAKPAMHSTRAGSKKK
jgi:hypothetical protein